MGQLLDYSAGYPGGSAVTAAGYEGVIRYLRKEGDSKVRPITVAELADMLAHGRTVALVYQHVSKARPTQGLAAGQHDAEWARGRAHDLGIADPFIYFAVDFDAVPADVAAYFTGTRAVLGLNRSGAYGSDKVLKFLFDRTLISKGWQTAAWSGGRREARAHLYQRVGQVTVGGVSCDVNDILKPDYGQYPYYQHPLTSSTEERLKTMSYVGIALGEIGKPGYRSGVRFEDGTFVDLTSDGKAIQSVQACIDAKIVPYINCQTPQAFAALTDMGGEV